MRNTTKPVGLDRDAAKGLVILLGLALGFGMAIYHDRRAVKSELEQKCAALGRAGDDACVEHQANVAVLDNLSLALRVVTPRYWAAESRAVRKRCSLEYPEDRQAQNRCYLMWDRQAVYSEALAAHGASKHNYEVVQFGGAAVLKRR